MANIFYGQGFSPKLKAAAERTSGATVREERSPAIDSALAHPSLFAKTLSSFSTHIAP